MGVTGWLADKSALTRLRHSPDVPQWLDRIDRGLVRITTATSMEIAAAAELGGLIVLHVDKDYELIAEITGQPTERLRV